MRTGLKATAKKIKELNNEIQEKKQKLRNGDLSLFSDKDKNRFIEIGHSVTENYINSKNDPNFDSKYWTTLFLDKENLGNDILRLRDRQKSHFFSQACQYIHNNAKDKLVEYHEKLNEIGQRLDDGIDKDVICDAIQPKIRDMFETEVTDILQSAFQTDTCASQAFGNDDIDDDDWFIHKISFEKYYSDFSAIQDIFFDRKGVLRERFRNHAKYYVDKWFTAEFDQIYGKGSYKILRNYSIETPNCQKTISKLLNAYSSCFSKITQEQVDTIIENDGFLRGQRDLYFQQKRTRDAIMANIPENYIDFYPLARQMKREFFIHVGPTNSGKTYEAIQKLKTAKSGIYLAPLRLLAFEQYENLNKTGTPCSLLTGEESKFVDGANIQSSTIEMADISKHYDVAVIDEGQMIADKNRGRSWTQAILGLCANEIHITTSPIALNIIRDLILSCGDSCTVIEHERNTSLIFQEELFKYPNDVQKGDALIVFSRNDVHAVANELNQNDIKCSIIYGKLPYDVRQKEAQKFASGETDVVVATDAIGMGMNLPIKRIVFLSTSKYNGNKTAQIGVEEVKQIAGRAGRYGMFNEGFVNSPSERKYIRKALNSTTDDIKTIYLPFSESLINLPEKLSLIFTAWNKIKARPPFKMQDISHMQRLLTQIEDCSEDKYLLYKIVSIPFDEKNYSLYAVWTELADKYIRKEDVSYDKYLKKIKLKSTNMEILEQYSQLCDLLYSFVRIFEPEKEEIKKKIENSRNKISRRIMEMLDKRSYTKRVCKCCGQPLPWDYQYGYCKWCYNGYGDW